MTSKTVAHIKLEPVDDTEQLSSKSESPYANTTPRLLEAANMSDLSTALISPGFSLHVLTNERVRENLRQSISVKHKQEDIIQQRLNEPMTKSSSATVQQKLQRKQAMRLSLNSSERVERAHQTAPLHGLMRTPGVTCQMPCQFQHMYHGRQPMYQAPYQYYHHQQPLLRRHSRPSPYERPANPEQGHSHHVQKTPGLAPSIGQRFTPPRSADHGDSNVVRLPDQSTLLRHPITPPTERDEEGLTTLSRAARWKTMKESYMQACSDSFDALHGLTM
jgi:hypothetical protein